MTETEGRRLADSVIDIVLTHEGADRAAVLQTLLAGMISTAINDERRYWVEALDAALCEEPVAMLAVPTDWRAGIWQLIDVRLAARVDAEREEVADAYEAAMMAEGISKYQRERIHEGVTERAPRRGDMT